ncbi:MAG: PqqD family protein [Pseudomonadota bacterium]|nr:PqqD family protein [Pseudomonadota bacterium]
MTETIFERNASLLEAGLGDELVALDAEGGQCFGFNATAASVWRRLEQPASFDALRLALREEYDVDHEQCTSELEALLDELIERGLVRVQPQAPSA